MTTNTIYPEGRSVLASLRAVIPVRTLDFAEALQVAELQAARLLELTDSLEGPFDSQTISELPRLRIKREALPTSGMSFWDGHSWIIVLNAAEPSSRQRFTLLHEYKHIIDHGSADRLYLGTAQRSSSRQAEQAADYFAGCALMPKRLMKRAWGERIQQPQELARHFQVSERAIEVRLAQLGLTEPRDRCLPPPTATARRPRRATYFRALSLSRRLLRPVPGAVQ